MSRYTLFTIGDPGAWLDVAGVLGSSDYHDLSEILDSVSKALNTEVVNASMVNKCIYYLSGINNETGLPIVGLVGVVMEFLKEKYGFLELDDDDYVLLLLTGSDGEVLYRLVVGDSVRVYTHDVLINSESGSLERGDCIFHYRNFHVPDIDRYVATLIGKGGPRFVDYCQVHSFI